MSGRKLLATCAAILLVATLAPTAAAQKGHEATDATVTNPDDGTEIAITIFRPAGASASRPVPVVFHSHGWSGSRTRQIGGVVERFLDAGLGVVSIDQRGHGESGGQAHVQDPTKETEDIQAVIDHVAELSWVLHDLDARGKPIADDPILGAIGGSYGGGYQTMTALDEIAEEGRTRFNALAPEITWFDLPESLAPQKVPRTTWDTVLYAAGARMVPRYIHEAFVWSAATGQWPDGTVYGEKVSGVPDLDSIFHKHSPVWFANKGIRIDVPVLLRQGTSDNLFNLNEGLNIFQRAVTPGARSQSYFIGYNGGHALPNATPPGIAIPGDACVEDFTELTISFFKKVFSKTSTHGLLPRRYNLTTADGSKCLRLGSVNASKTVKVETPIGGTITTAGFGAPIHIPVAEGPLTLTGVPTLRGKVTSVGLDARAFFALSVGTTPADALVVQNNVLPLRRLMPAQDKKFKIELPGVAVEVPEGQSLFLTVSPTSDMYVGHGSRTPGALVLTDLKLSLPAARR